MSSLLCRFDFHSWTDWERSACTEVRTCLRDGCEKQSIRPLLHKYGEWHKISEKGWAKIKYRYFNEGRECAIERDCLICGEIEATIEHSWGDWGIGSSSCMQTRNCTICGQGQVNCSHADSEHHQVCTVCGEQLDPLMNC